MNTIAKAWILALVIAFVAALFVIESQRTYIAAAQEGIAEARESVADARDAVSALKPAHTFDDLLDAIEWVESRGEANAVGDNGRAVGAYQIHKIYVDDVNRIWGSTFTYEDRWDKQASRNMTRMYLLHYVSRMPKSCLEFAARIHNGGPNGWRKESTKAYWEKVKWALKWRGNTFEVGQDANDYSIRMEQ